MLDLTIKSEDETPVCSGPEFWFDPILCPIPPSINLLTDESLSDNECPSPWLSDEHSMHSCDQHQPMDDDEDFDDWISSRVLEDVMFEKMSDVPK